MRNGLRCVVFDWERESDVKLRKSGGFGTCFYTYSRKSEVPDHRMEFRHYKYFKVIPGRREGSCGSNWKQMCQDGVHCMWNLFMYWHFPLNVYSGCFLSQPNWGAKDSFESFFSTPVSSGRELP